MKNFKELKKDLAKIVEQGLKDCLFDTRSRLSTDEHNGISLSIREIDDSIDDPMFEMWMHDVDDMQNFQLDTFDRAELEGWINTQLQEMVTVRLSICVDIIGRDVGSSVFNPAQHFNIGVVPQGDEFQIATESAVEWEVV